MISYSVGKRNRGRKEFTSHSSASTDEMKAEKNDKILHVTYSIYMLYYSAVQHALRHFN